MPINYKEYHPRWHLISRMIRFRRAGNCCELCWAKNYQPHPVTRSKVVLTVAHMDHDKSNNADGNLKALCQRCHLRHDLPHHINNRKYGRNWKRVQLTLDL